MGEDHRRTGFDRQFDGEIFEVVLELSQAAGTGPGEIGLMGPPCTVLCPPFQRKLTPNCSRMGLCTRAST